MSENQKRILQMLAEGKITVDEASRLLSALGDDSVPGEKGAGAKNAMPRYVIRRRVIGVRASPCGPLYSGPR